jgi:hypothetical protein
MSVESLYWSPCEMVLHTAGRAPEVSGVQPLTSYVCRTMQCPCRTAVFLPTARVPRFPSGEPRW